MGFNFKSYLSHHYRKQLTKQNNLLLISHVMDYQSGSLYFLFLFLLSILQDILDESTVLSQLISGGGEGNKKKKKVSCPKDKNFEE